MALNLHEIKQVVKKFGLNAKNIGSDVLRIDSTSIKVHPYAAVSCKTNGEQSIERLKSE